MGDLHRDPISDKSLALMKGWIHDCQHRHQLCMETPQRCDYIALSYCWGNVKVPLTTRQETKNGVPPTLERHQLGIPDGSLSPLHQEVVTLARGLDKGPRRRTKEDE